MAQAGLQGSAGGKSADAFRTIREVSEDLGVPQHVLRFWETKFTQVRPLKRGGGRRYYRPQDIALLRRIQTLLYAEGYTIRGVQKLLRDGGVKALLADEAAGSAARAAAQVPTTEVASAAFDGDARGQVTAVIKELSELRDMLRGRIA